MCMIVGVALTMSQGHHVVVCSRHARVHQDKIQIVRFETVKSMCRFV